MLASVLSGYATANVDLVGSLARFVDVSSSQLAQGRLQKVPCGANLHVPRQGKPVVEGSLCPDEGQLYDH